MLEGTEAFIAYTAKINATSRQTVHCSAFCDTLRGTDQTELVQKHLKIL